MLLLLEPVPRRSADNPGELGRGEIREAMRERILI